MIDWSVIRQEYEQGSSLRVLAAKHGVGKSTIARKLALQAASWYNEAAKNVVPGGAANTPGRIHSRRNVPMDTLPPHDLDGNPIPEKRSTDWRKIRFEYEAGSSLRMLAARYNMGKSTIAERKLKERWTQDELKEQCVKGKRWTLLKPKGYQSSTSLYSIYSLTDPRDHLVRYIGISRDVIRRFGDHISSRNESNGAKSAWILDLRSQVLYPVLTVLETDLPFFSARERESYWIRYFTDVLDMPLVNINSLTIREEDINYG